MSAAILESPQLLELFQNGLELSYERDEIIIRAEDIPSGVYYVASGWVKAYTVGKDGEPTIIMTLFPGDVFPCAWAVTGSLQGVNFAALDETTLLRTPTDIFTKAIRTSPAISQAVLNIFANQFYSLTNELDNLQYHNAREKIILRLLFLAKNFGKCENNKIIIKKRIPNEYIARSTNMTRETTSREMSRLTRERLVRHTEEQLILPDVRGLEDELRQNCQLAKSQTFERDLSKVGER